MKIITILLFTLLPYIAKAQALSGNSAFANEPARLGQKLIVDTCRLECIYYYRIIDHESNDMREYDAIVEVGDSIAKYESYQAYRLDSVLSVKKTVTNKDFFDLSAKYQPKFGEFMLENFNENTLDYYGKVSIDNYTYREPIPTINWNLTDSIKQVCGYFCKQATCTFRGRQWTAWYCDIPQSVGPWKLNGLPGLILEAETIDKEHYFSAITIRKANVPMGYWRRSYFKTNRERFNKSLLDYKNNPTKSWKNTSLTPKDMNGKPMPIPKRKLFYSPLEKE